MFFIYLNYNTIITMRSFIVKKKQQLNRSLRRVKSLQQNDRIRATTIHQKTSETQDRRTLLTTTKNRQYSKSLTRTNIPYQGFIKEMKIRLPSPKQKFYQFLKIQPFNRNLNHNELIQLFLKNVKFFKIHQDSLIENMAKKVYLVDANEIDQKMMIIILQGELYTTGQLINRKILNPNLVSTDSMTKLLAISRHQYVSFLNSYIRQQIKKLKDFIYSIQLFKMLNQRTVSKCIDNLSLFYFLKGERLYKMGDDADLLYIILKGKVSRNVIIEIQKVNKIPYRRFERQVRILSKTYSHKIEFGPEQIVGVTELVDGVNHRKQQIDIDQDSILLGIDRRIIQEQLDDYIIDRLKKYNIKKYPENYDQLCEFYQKQKEEMKKTEERKINALKNSFIASNSDKRKDKIKQIIKVYEENIKLVQNKNLISRKLHFDIDYTK